MLRCCGDAAGAEDGNPSCPGGSRRRCSGALVCGSSHELLQCLEAWRYTSHLTSRILWTHLRTCVQAAAKEGGGVNFQAKSLHVSTSFSLGLDSSGGAGRPPVMGVEGPQARGERHCLTHPRSWEGQGGEERPQNLLELPLALKLRVQRDLGK